MDTSACDDILPPGSYRQVSIETTRLSLTNLRIGDLDEVMAVFGQANTARMTHAIPHPFRRSDAEKLLSEMMAKPHVWWAIRLPDERLVGVIGLTGTACGSSGGLHSFGPNLSVFVAPEHQGNGYALEAIEGLLDWVKRKRLHKVIHAAHFADNLTSARMLNAADFLYTGRRTMETSLAREGEHQALHMIRLL